MDDLPRNHFLMHATMVQHAAAKGVPMPEVAVAVAGDAGFSSAASAC